MPELITIRTSRPRAGLLARMAESLRAYWTGAFSLKDPALNQLFGVGSRTIAGPMVNEITAFTCAAFWDGVNQISSDTAKLPLNLKIRDTNGGSKDYIASKNFKLLKYSPNPYTRSMVFRRTLTMHALVYGNGYAEIVRDGNGQPAGLYILQPWRVSPKFENKRLVYVIDGETRLNPADVLHIHGLGDDGVMGLNLVHVAREALGLAIASQQFASAFFGNGTRFGGVLSSDHEITEDDEKGIRKHIEDLHAKADKAFRLLILGGGFTFTESGVKPRDAEMSEIRNHQVTECARYLNMPLHRLKLNAPGAVSYASVEMADLDYYKGPILTWTRIWEEELDAKLISSLELGRQYFKHNVDAFLRGDIKSRYEALGIARDKGIINADEWRALEDMNPQPDGQGAVYLVQSAQIPVGKLSELVDAQIAETKQKAKPPTSANDEAVRIAQERAETAEQIAAEAQQRANEAEKRIAVIEATGTATADELEALREDHRKLQDVATNLTVLSTDLRERVDLVQTAKDVSDEQARALSGDKARVETELAELRAVAERNEQHRINAERDAQEARAREAEARTAAEANAATVSALKAEAQAAGSETETMKAALAEAVQNLVDARDQLDAAVNASQVADSRVATIEMLSETNREELERVKRESDRIVAELTGQYAQEREAREAEALARAEAERKQADAASHVSTLEAEHAASRERAEAAETALAAVRAEKRARLTLMATAHRALIVDAMGRMARREAEQARKRQATPEKLRAWLKTFDALHAEICTEALLPAIRTHLAWKGSKDDPRDVTETMVRQHLVDFRERMLAVADAGGEDFHATLAKTLERWESDQPERMADEIMRDALKHLGDA